MSPDKERTIAENEAPAQDAPLTKEAAKAQLRLIAERAKAAGLNPLRILIETYIERGRAISAGLLAGLESDDNPKKKSKD